MGQIKPLPKAVTDATRHPTLLLTGDDPVAGYPSARTLPDAERLVRQAFASNPNEGVTLLFRHYYQPLCSHAVRYVSSKEIAEDLVSDIFFEFQSRLLYQTINTSFRAFLFTAVRNRALDYIRTEYQHAASLDQAQHLSTGIGQQPDGVTQYEELYQHIETAINGMPPKQRTVYLMHRFEGKKYALIAHELGMAPKTVEVHMHRALGTIREFLRSKWLLGLLLCWLPALH